jgi:hypothetical protein
MTISLREFGMPMTVSTNSPSMNQRRAAPWHPTKSARSSPSPRSGSERVPGSYAPQVSGRALATYEIPIEGRDEWLAAARRLA